MLSVHYPKKTPDVLIKKTLKAVIKIKSGVANFRKTQAHGYLTMDLGSGNRLVMVNSMASDVHVFNGHKDYERFISRSH